MCAKVLKMLAYIIGKIARMTRANSWLRKLYAYVIFKAIETDVKEFRNESIVSKENY